MRNIKIDIEYDGTHFEGWQIQKPKSRTVQGEIEKALARICKKKNRVIGSGRTDSGVHALGQVAHAKIPSRLSDPEILRALNANLPDDISILNVQTVPDSFHAQFSVKRKTYRYTILNRTSPPAMGRHFCLHLPQGLNVTAMRREAKYLVGRKDFRSFMAADRAKRHLDPGRSTVRRIYNLTLKKTGDTLTITIEADGFLYKMVRNVVGTLIQVGQEKHPKGFVKALLKKKNRVSAGKTAAACGLCLVKVVY